MILHYVKRIDSGNVICFYILFLLLRGSQLSNLLLVSFLPVKRKMAILLRRLALIDICLYGPFKHQMHIALCPNTHLGRDQQHAYQQCKSY